MLLREISIVLGTLAIATLGFALDLRVGNDAFARSGALIVIFGVILVGRAVYVAEKTANRYEARYEKLEAAYMDAAANGEGDNKPEVFTRLATIYGELRQTKLRQVSRLMAIEIFIVCFGTLIWGFGDLAV